MADNASSRCNAVRLLLDKGADPDGLGRPGEHTPLMMAVTNNQEGTARILIEHGADPDLKAGFGFSPRQLAEGNERMVSILASGENRNGRGTSESAPSVPE